MNAAGERLVIFDTTLRDGEQSPGCTMHSHEKLLIAQGLSDLGVDVIEAGFPAASPGDLESVREIARRVNGPVVCALARCARGDISDAWEALRDAPRPRIHVFLATSAIHREHKLNMGKAEILERTKAGVSMARELCGDVEFSPEDASRTEPDFLAEVVEGAIASGATTINIPDTVGYAVPEQYGEVFAYLRRHVRGIENAVLSAHCHDDLGLALANSLAAIRHGARQVECTINGIGERAGNCALEELVMAVRTRADAMGIGTDIRSRLLHPLSRLLSSVTGVQVQPNKAIVGENAFSHEAGIHQHGVMRNAATYEIMRPEDVGAERGTLVLGKHSGRHAFRERVRQLGFELAEPELEAAFAGFKRLADKKKRIYDGDIEAIVLGAELAEKHGWRMEAMHTSSGTHIPPTATIRLAPEAGASITEAATGDGPVDAAFRAIQRAVGIHPSVKSYRVRSVTDGQDAQGEVVLEVEWEGDRFRGRGVSTDVVEASARAYLDVLNRILRLRPLASPRCPTSSARAVCVGTGTR